MGVDSARFSLYERIRWSARSGCVERVLEVGRGYLIMEGC